MHEQIREAFGQIHAEPAVKGKTLEAVERQLAARSRMLPGTRARLLSSLACLVILLLGGGWWAYFTPTAAISIDVNPALLLEVNRFDRVVSAEGLNEDGQALADQLRLKHLSCQAALERLLDSAPIAGLLAEEEELTIAVSGSSDAQCGRLLEEASACAGENPNVRCYGVSQEEAQAAGQAGLSVGKYRAFLELQALDPSVTPDDVRDLTMREIREQILAAQGGQTDGAQGPGVGQGSQHGPGGGQNGSAGQGWAGGRGSQ